MMVKESPMMEHVQGCASKHRLATKKMVAQARATGKTQQEAADIIGVTRKTVSLWEKDDVEYREAFDAHLVEMTRGYARELVSRMDEITRNVASAACKDPELGLKLLDKCGVLRHTGNLSGMSQAEKENGAATVVIQVMGEVSKEGTPVIDVDAVMEGDVDDNG